MIARGGEIAVTSSDAQGTLFCVKLPRFFDDTESGTVRSERGAKSILVIDDEPGLCEVLQDYFEDLGFEVHTATDVRCAGFRTHPAS
ncbi:MAG: hypothetical protein H0V17_23535 [Deltaproteobacteria bacterium]|nr:hypothetical protein [Deltaproteobacteria bacterium]